MTATWVMAMLCSIFFSVSLTVNAQPNKEQTVHEQNSTLVQDFNPQPLWKYFIDLCAIPRCPGNELAASQLVVDVATENHLKFMRDSLNNVLVYLPASPGFENRPPICVQGHLDMVCETKAGSNIIFPLKLIQKGDTLNTTGSTLGADNGFGVSAMLTLMSEKNQHGPLELLFTTYEEVGLVGAKGFDYSLLKSKLMYNVDSEEEGIVTIGCAGGAVMQITLLPKFVDSGQPGCQYLIKVSNFKGGHSGSDIHLNHGNAIKVMTFVLSELKDFDFGLVALSGGSAINTIPRECEATIFLPDNETQGFSESFERLKEEIFLKFPSEQPQITFEKILDIKAPKIMRKLDQEKLLSILNKLPNGVMSMESRGQEMVRTSNNIGAVEIHNDTLLVKMLFRSSSNAQIDSVIKVTELISAGEKTEMIFRIPPWEPDFNAPLVAVAASIYKDIFQKELIAQTVHAGLESSIFYEKMPGIQIISFGPTIGKAHTPDEYVCIQSVEKFWDYLLALVKK